MPTSRKTTKAAMAAAAAMPSIPKELIDQFVTGPMSAQAVNAVSMAFKKALIERALGAELSHHLGYRPGATKPEDAVNQRNGASGKTVLTEDGPLRIDVPRDREGSFDCSMMSRSTNTSRSFSGSRSISRLRISRVSASSSRSSGCADQSAMASGSRSSMALCDCS